MNRQQAIQIHGEEALVELELHLENKYGCSACLGKLCINVDYNGFFHYSKRGA